ncbi:MAG: extracellular solute-binding protein [Oxalobacteraceae bacterium]
MTIRRFLSICLLATSFAILPGALAADVLRILAWPGYAEPDIVAEFGRRHGVRIELSYVTSDDDLWARMSRNNGADFDVFAVNTAELQRYIDHSLAAPINPAQIRNQANQAARFRNLSATAALSRNGHIYAIPYTFSEMGLIYNRKIVKTPPSSMSVLWDPRYRGRVLAYSGGSQNFSNAAFLMQIKNPFQLSDDDLTRVAKRLVDLRRNVLSFYTSPEEAVKLFRDNEIAYVYGNYGMQQVKKLRAAGADVGYVIPPEGALAWLDCWVVSAGRKSQHLAETWIDYMLEKNVSQALTEKQGLANTMAPAAAATISAGNDHILWLEPVENVTKRKVLWDRIISGDNLDNY